MLELVVDAVAIFFRLAIKEGAHGVKAGEIGELIERDPGALDMGHAVIADYHQVDGQAGCIESRLELADQCIDFVHGGASFRRVGAELVAFVVGFGVVDGDEVRAVGRGKLE